MLGTKAGTAADSLLVLPNLVLSRQPFDVASTDGSTVAVFFVFVLAVVGNV
jgi:hypothetical protein